MVLGLTHGSFVELADVLRFAEAVHDAALVAGHMVAKIPRIRVYYCENCPTALPRQAHVGGPSYRLRFQDCARFLE